MTTAKPDLSTIVIDCLTAVVTDGQDVLDRWRSQRTDSNGKVKRFENLLLVELVARLQAVLSGRGLHIVDLRTNGTVESRGIKKGRRARDLHLATKNPAGSISPDLAIRACRDGGRDHVNSPAAQCSGCQVLNAEFKTQFGRSAILDDVRLVRYHNHKQKNRSYRELFAWVVVAGPGAEAVVGREIDRLRHSLRRDEDVTLSARQVRDWLHVCWSH